jgi:hypothetical protein
MSFLNPALLGWLGLLALPLLIHLLLRARKHKLRFSTLLFFRKLDEQAARRRKLKHWLLLAMRTLLLAALVLAFARPYWPEPKSNNVGQIRRRFIFVIDRSASMAAVEKEGQRWTGPKRRCARL